jgi:hypothetical protein
VSDERGAFLDAYDEHRVTNQEEWYRARTDEYETSANQIGWANELCLFAAAACGAAAALLPEYALWLGAVAAGLAAVGAALTSWADVIGFAMNAELYSAARAGLSRLRPNRPRADASPADVEEYIGNVEDILLGEVRSWSQKWGAAAEDIER